jgi:hypothetical protein
MGSDRWSTINGTLGLRLVLSAEIAVRQRVRLSGIRMECFASWISTIDQTDAVSGMTRINDRRDQTENET